MKGEMQISSKLRVLKLKLEDAWENPNSEYDASDIQARVDELLWVLE